MNVATRTGRVLGLLMLACATSPAAALVHYEQGRMELMGVQLLQDADEPHVYYYLPQAPYLAQKDDGEFELLCIKFVDTEGDASGGLLHALVQFDLPQEAQEALQSALEQEVPGAVLAGPVPLQQTLGDDGDQELGSFEVISGILSDQQDGGFTRSVVTSGAAPLTPGSKAVVAAVLNPNGATLMWDSLTGATSDLSIGINASYEARVKAYNARVIGEIETIYNHRSVISNTQQGYTRRQMRRVTDQLVQDGALTVEVFDRTRSLGLDADDMEAILEIVTDRLTELMFDSTTGWAQEPEREAAVEAGQLPGRQERGWFSKVFGGARDEKYVTDNQWVLKRREDIRQHRFELILDKETTIRVPFHTAGNLGGLYRELGDDERHFRIVNLDDPAFETRTVHFQVDGNYIDAFQEHVNYVSVNFRKRRDDRPDHTRSLHFSHADIEAGRTLQSVVFPRLGEEESDWTEFEYQVRWSTRDQETISVPEDPEEWLRTTDPAVSLVPPFEKRTLMVDVDPQSFLDSGVRSAVVEFATDFLGEPQVAKRLILRSGDAETTHRIALFHDRNAPIVQRTSWYADWGHRREALQRIDGDYLYLMAPEPPAPPPAPEGP
jgi:hypothetical protein